MATALSIHRPGGVLISRDNLRAGLGNIAATLPQVKTGGVDFLNMDKTGEWSYGVDGTVVNATSIWAINPTTLQHGWIAWSEQLGQEPLGEIMVSALSKPLPNVETLPPVKDGRGYQQQYGVELTCISGPDEGAVVLYKNTTVGAMKLFNVYIAELFERVENEDDHLVALVNLTSESYMHKKYGKTFNPVLNYVEWREPDDVSAPGETAEPEPEVKTTRAAKPAPATAEQAAEAPEDEDEDDRIIREIQERKAAKAAAAAAPAEEEEAPAEDTPRRRQRR